MCFLVLLTDSRFQRELYIADTRLALDVNDTSKTVRINSSNHTLIVLAFYSEFLRPIQDNFQPRSIKLRFVYQVLSLPWVPEPQNLNERKLVRGKERRKKGGRTELFQLSFLPSLFFSFYYFLALVPRVVLS